MIDWGKRQYRRDTLIRQIGRERAQVKKALGRVNQFKSEISSSIGLASGALGRRWSWAAGGAGMIWLFVRWRRKTSQARKARNSVNTNL